ncbi:hypothetical protein B2A_14887, partial [mine drainage metagenome]
HSEVNHMASEQELLRRIERVKAEITKLGDLRPGKVSVQYNTCGTPNCRCKADPPQRHGPYYQLNYTRGGRSRTETVHREHLAQVEAQIRNYHKLRALLERWTDAAIELDR